MVVSTGCRPDTVSNTPRCPVGGVPVGDVDPYPVVVHLAVGVHEVQALRHIERDAYRIEGVSGGGTNRPVLRGGQFHANRRIRAGVVEQLNDG